MSAWENLVNGALLGTERQQLPGTDEWANPRLAALLQKFDQSDREGTLLRTGAAFTVLRRASSKGAKAALQTNTGAEGESRQQCTTAAAGYLQRLLAGEHRGLLPQWLKRVAARGEIAPPQLLPMLLDATRQDAELHELVRVVLGNRGAWLAQQNPDWKKFTETVDVESTWQSGSLSSRREWLKAQHAADAERARKLLEEAFSSEPARSRAELLSALQENLSPADEPLLEKALDDKSKEVRAAAVELLSRLPGGAFAQRMNARARNYIRLRKINRENETTIEVTLPEEVDADGRRDGVIEKLVLGPKIGTKAAILYQYLRAVPPHEWEREFEVSPEVFLDACEKSEFAEMLRLALVDAATRHHDESWLRLFLSPGSGYGKKLPEPLLFMMLQSLPPQARDEVLCDLLTAEDIRGTHLIQHHAGPWSAELSQVVMRTVLRPMLSQVQAVFLYGEILKQARLALHASVAQEVTEISTSAVEIGGTIGDRWLEFLNFYQFRITMEKELES
jgi:hypothetical protein